MQAVKENVKRSEVLCIRIDRELAEEIRNEAEYLNISLNVLVNRIFRRYVEWERDAERVGFVPVTKEFLQAVLDKLNESQIEQLVMTSVRNLADIIIYMQKKLDIYTFIQWLDNLCKVSGFAKKHVSYDSIHTFIVQHDLGVKCSIYLKALLQLIFSKLNKKIEPLITPQSITFTVEIEQGQAN